VKDKLTVEKLDQMVLEAIAPEKVAQQGSALKPLLERAKKGVTNANSVRS